jgi:hypothetical protein
MAADPLRISFPDTPAPPGSQWNWVGRQMVVDGLPMAIKTFSYKGSEEDMIAHFESVWSTLGHGTTVRSRIGPKSVLIDDLSDFYTTVQYEVQGEHITGSITVSVPLSEKRKPSKPLIASPPGSKTVSHIESNDLGIYSETITLMSRRSVDFNSGYYENQLRNKGWLKIDNRCSLASCDGQYQSTQGQLQISIKDLPAGSGNGSRILIHLIKQ